MNFFQNVRMVLSSRLKRLFRRSAIYELKSASSGESEIDGISTSELDRLESLAAKFPSMGGKEIGAFLRNLARNAPAHTTIVEVGSWLGAGTAQLAIGLRERGTDRSVKIHTYDRWVASKPEIAKATQKANLSFEPGQDTLPWVMQSLQPFGAGIEFTKGDIAVVDWAGAPISVYIDDAAKSPSRFFHVLRTFGPAWIPGVTVLVLMDFHYWEKTGSEEHKCQKYFIDAHAEHFSPVAEFRRGSNAAFIYRKQLDFARLKFDSLLRPVDI
jgi:hypothetical protein